MKNKDDRSATYEDNPDDEYFDLLNQYYELFFSTPYELNQRRPPKWQIRWCVENKKNIDQAPQIAGRDEFLATGAKL